MNEIDTKPRRGLLASMIEQTVRTEPVLRARYPQMYRDPDRLVIEQVAWLLCCSIDQARRIPRDELPAYRGPGKRLLYLREDVLRYIKKDPVRSQGTRLNSKVRRVGNKATIGETKFDPGVEARRLRSEES
jgi:hypothetical protein